MSPYVDCVIISYCSEILETYPEILGRVDVDFGRLGFQV